MLAEALFERVDALGFRELSLSLTDTAIAHGFAAVIPDTLDLGIVGYGRGERGSASLTHLRFRPRFVLENVTEPPNVWHVAERKAS